MITSFYFVLDKKSSDFFRDQIGSIMMSINNYYQVPVWNLDKKLIAEISEAFLKNKVIKGIRILDEIDQEIFSSSSASKSFAELKNEVDVVFKETKINYQENNYLGKIQVIFSDEVYREQNQRTILNIIFMIVFFSLLIILSSYSALNHFLQKPLKILLEAVQAATRTNYSVRVADQFPAELGILASEFNKAMQAIQESDRKLNENNLALERTVEERSRQLDEQRAQMINSSRLASLGEFSAGIAHEINNPLAVIAGNARIIGRQVEKGVIDENMKLQIQKILDMGLRIQKIIKNLRTFSRDGTRDAIQPFEVKKFIDDITLLSKVRLERSDIILQVVNRATIDVLFAQEISLSQVIVNVINNAADAVVNLKEKWVRLEIENDNKWFKFIITDSGHGIPKDIQEKMMNPFFTTKEVGKGTGLGLSISHGIIKSHHGELLYNSKCENTQFIILIPLDLGQQKAESA